MPFEKVDGQDATVTVAIRGLDMSSSLDTQFAPIGGQITQDTEDKAIIAMFDEAWRKAHIGARIHQCGHGRSQPFPTVDG